MTLRQLAFILVWTAFSPANIALLADEAAQAEAKASATDAGIEQDAERKLRAEFLKSDLDRYTVVAADRPERPLSVTEKPVLRYTNPVRTSFTDGAVYLWLDGQRPLAAAVLSIRDNGNVVRELVSFTERPLICKRDGRSAWTPKSGNLVDQPLGDAPPPDGNNKRRLRQMREAAGRFRVIKKSSPDLDLRLLGQPVYRYSAAAAGVIDGAVFAFVEATDPDFLLVLEAHREDPASPAEWRYTLGRMLSGPLEVELDGKPLWAGEGYWTSPRSISDPYVEIPFGTYPPPAEKVQSP
ncbi:MAG TPA: hypothetical protein VFI31_16945 [Pirellulales bacterium]|nr:hypothetical protein [Pirellulales bacterium]